MRAGLGIVLLATALGTQAQAATGVPYVDIPAGELRTVLANDGDRGPVSVAAFSLRVLPVTRSEFALFLRQHPQWGPGQVPRTFANAGYLQDGLDTGSPQAPVTQVSWFAAQAFCESEGARLPSWNEWERVAAADADHADARQDPIWRARILGWYARPATGPLPDVGGPPNFYGVRDMHGLIWEWVDDFNALLVSPDSRDQGDPDKLKFCGAGAISLQDRENYAVLMRIALLSSLQAADSTTSLGFRCAR